MLSRLISRALHRFTDWALSKNAPGGYAGEDDKRWAYTIVTEGSPYLTRVLFPRVRLPKLGPFPGCDFRPMLHHFHRGDGDQDLHNHPWRWGLSFILSGSYVEERLEAVLPNINGDVTVATETRLVRFFNRLTDTDYHRVRELRGDVWTLFVTGERSQDWGFLVRGKHVPWRDYLAEGKKD